MTDYGYAATQIQLYISCVLSLRRVVGGGGYFVDN